jgi:hypothetical protein
VPDGLEVDLGGRAGPLDAPPALGYSVAFSIAEARLAWVRVAAPDTAQPERMCLPWTGATVGDVRQWLAGRFGNGGACVAAFASDGTGAWRRLDLADESAPLLGTGVLEHRVLLAFRDSTTSSSIENAKSASPIMIPSS